MDKMSLLIAEVLAVMPMATVHADTDRWQSTIAEAAQRYDIPRKLDSGRDAGRKRR